MERNNSSTTTINGVVVEPLISSNNNNNNNNNNINNNNKLTGSHANKVKRIVRNHSFKSISASSDHNHHYQPAPPPSQPQKLGITNAPPSDKSRSRAVMQPADYYNTHAVSGSGHTLNNNPSYTQPSTSMPARDNYKSLNDVFGTEASMTSSMISNNSVASSSTTGKSHLSKNVSLPLNGHLPNGSNALKAARSITSMNMPPPSEPPVYKHVPLSRNVPSQNPRYMGAQPVPNMTHRFGNPELRSSYSEKISGGGSSARSSGSSKGSVNHSGLPVSNSQRDSGLYKSNSSLDLDHEVDMVQEAINNSSSLMSSGMYRREFGSHGSIDVISRQEMQHPQSHHQLFGDIRSFDSSSIDGVTLGGGPAAMSTLTRKSEESASGSVMSSGSLEESPKQKKKAGFFSSSSTSTKEVKGGGGGGGQKSIFKKFRGSTKETHSGDSLKGLVNGEVDPNSDKHLEDRHRRRFFLHNDIGSVSASLSVTTHLKTLERRNTTTGASAASAALRRTDHVTTEAIEKDIGDNVSNDLVLSCPYFRNEIGGEVERKIALTRQNSSGHTCDTQSPTTATIVSTTLNGSPISGSSSASSSPLLSAAVPSSSDALTLDAHTPPLARGFSLLDSPETYWKNGFCPYRRTSTNVIERIDHGATFFKTFFYGKEHQNWFGVDEQLGPVAISIRREKVNLSGLANNGHAFLASTPSFSSMDNLIAEQHMYRIMIRTSELLPLRGSVLEDSIPALKSEKIKTLPTREVLEFVCPEIQLSSLHLGIQSGPCEEELIRLDEAYVQNKYKVGLMYCREGQQTEEDMYNNEEGGAAFNEFLELIGQKVRLKGFNQYKAGLCNKNDSTGLYSVYTEHAGNELMFHVSTFLPFTPNNRQQLPRKRYIGNEIVTVVFQEPGALPFIPNLKSQFQHVFIVVRAHNPCSEHTQYSVAVSRSKSVPIFGPPIPKGARFAKTKGFADFLLTKIINAENAAHRSDKFVSMAVRTRQELLKDLATNFISSTTLDSGSKFSLFGKKKDKSRARFLPEAAGLRGALSWRVVVEDYGSSTKTKSRSNMVTSNQNYSSSKGTVALPVEIEALVAISPDSILVIQESHQHEVLFITAAKSVLGWTVTPNSIRIYFHQGEALILHSKDRETEDMSEIAHRLKAVTNGAVTQEFTLRRNQMGQLGFHVQHDGLITEVENFGYAWQTGLRQGSRLVEINKNPVSALSHEQMVELLKTSMTVTVTVIPPHPDASPRRGCHLKNCSFAFGAPSSSGDFDGDYENVVQEQQQQQQQQLTQQHTQFGPGGQQPVSNGKTVYDGMGVSGRSLSPPRSSNSSGYGTGSSRKSLSEQHQPQPRLLGHQQHQPQILEQTSGGEGERWYELGNEAAPGLVPEDSSPPPLPTRIGSKGSAFQKVTSSSGGLSNSTSTSNKSSLNNANASPSIYQRPPPPRVTRPSQIVPNGGVVFSNYAAPTNFVSNPAPNYQNHQPSTTVKIVGNSTQGLRNPYTSHYSAPANRVNAPNAQSHYGPSATSSINNATLPNGPNGGSGISNSANNSNNNNNNVGQIQRPIPTHPVEDAQLNGLQSNYEYLQHERLAALKSSSLPPEMVANRHGSNNTPTKLTAGVGGGGGGLSTYVVDGGHTTDSSSNSERFHAHRSEDELSGSSNSVSPQQQRRRRTNPHNTATSALGSSAHSRSGGSGGVNPPSSNGSRNQSPRTIARSATSAADEPVSSGIGVKKRSVSRNPNHRNSANLGSSSTFQEDLMKLISPEYNQDMDANSQKSKSSPVNLTSSVSISTNTPPPLGAAPQPQAISGKSASMSRTPPRAKSITELSLMKTRSRENIAGVGGSTTSGSPTTNNQMKLSGSSMADDSLSEGSFHMARPATVISNKSTDSSNMSVSSTSVNLSGKSDRSMGVPSTPGKKLLPNTPRVEPDNPDKTGRAHPMPLADERMDWTALVDTATRAIHFSADDSNVHNSQHQHQHQHPQASGSVPNKTEMRSRSTVVLNKADDHHRIKQNHYHSSQELNGPSHQNGRSGSGSPPFQNSDSKQNEKLNLLLDKLNKMESRLNSEAIEKTQLAEEVAALREENIRLQEESQTASQQLKKFTEWFFQTIDKT
ncbi:signal-induced proliferation-associated 1-like protein 2 isoform X2 [Tigriopus californicus]|uniref:signal-induced proliferation-associated 1-like protein 2 isoform X2 n=1 Tax=Tigriopus californicus TaxID=6832 RepID=UPI0027DA83F9|nr:signal-induced proliferation-associated 1-like protein 2 isoform X2 [Tigriopus californicus]